MTGDGTPNGVKNRKNRQNKNILSSANPPRIYSYNMRSIFRGGFVFFAIAALLIGAAIWYIFGTDGSPEIERGQALRSRRIAEKDSAKAGKGASRLLSAKKKLKGDSVTAVKVEKPNLTLSTVEDAQLTEEMRRIYQDLQQALDDEDKKKVFALVHKLQSMDEWPDGIPQAVKLRALDALAWFGASGMAEAVGFLADGDSEVVSTAIEKFEEMLCDFDLGDRGVSEILSQIVKVVHDTDALDSFYMEMNNMRDTVKAQTALNIYDSKNQEAISALEENLEFIFGDAEYEVKTREDVEKFLKDAEQSYKDDPEKAQDDEDFYGPPKD